MNKNIKIEPLKYPFLKKCGMCGRAKDIFFNATVYSVGDAKKDIPLVVGAFQLCKQCGMNFAEAIGEEAPPDEFTTKEFIF